MITFAVRPNLPDEPIHATVNQSPLLPECAKDLVIRVVNAFSPFALCGDAANMAGRFLYDEELIHRFFRTVPHPYYMLHWCGHT